MTDDLAGLGKAAVRLIDSGEKFLNRLIGPWLDETGQQLADGVRAKRRKNLAAIAGEAAPMVGDKPIQDVPGRILFPLLESAANEDDPILQSKWAALLANAATDSSKLLPAYAEILRQLTPLQAQMLDWIYRNTKINRTNPPPPTAKAPWFNFFMTVSRERLMAQFSIGVMEYNLMATDLHRLRLIEGGKMQMSIYASGGPVVQSTYSLIELTELAKHFVIAVNAPGTDLGGVALHSDAMIEIQEAEEYEAYLLTKRRKRVARKRNKHPVDK